MSPPTEVPSGQQLFMPPQVQREAERMASLTGVEPIVAYESKATIRITHENGPLRIESVYRRGSRGWQRSGSSLFQDGERREPLESWEEYFKLQEEISTTSCRPASLPTLNPLRQEDSSLPAEIRQNLALMRHRLGGRSDVDVRVGLDGKGRYVLAVSSAKATMHMAFDTYRGNGKKRVCIADTDPIRLVTTDGRDLTEEVQGKLREALAQLLAEPPSVDAAGGGSANAQGAQAGGPASRKGTVLRL